MKLLATLALLSLFAPAFTQSKNPFTKTSFSKEISFIRTDTTQGTQSTVIEYPKFLVVIELPLIHDGANRSTNLVEDIPKAERFLAFLQDEYHKPIKYVLSSHWHLHSLSGITPFFASGAKLVVAKTNWDYSIKNGLLGSSKADSKKLIQISKDTTLLNDTQNPIQILFLDQTYTFKPTKDYLFFYLPKSKTLHASCMCAMSQIDFKQRPDFVYNDRVTDLDKAISSRHLTVEHLIKLTAEYDKENKTYRQPTFGNSYFTEFKQRGTPLHAVVKKYSDCDLSLLTSGQDSILNHLVEKKISAQIINSTVYSCIKQKEYQKAVAWARILNLYQSGDLNFIDTLGEANFFLGNLEMAKHYSFLLFQSDALKFPNAIKTWEENKAESN